MKIKWKNPNNSLYAFENWEKEINSSIYKNKNKKGPTPRDKEYGKTIFQVEETKSYRASPNPQTMEGDSIVYSFWVQKLYVSRKQQTTYKHMIKQKYRTLMPHLITITTPSLCHLQQQSVWKCWVRVTAAAGSQLPRWQRYCFSLLLIANLKLVS